MKLRCRALQLPLREPQRIAGFAFTAVDVLRVDIEQDGRTGTGEASGLYFRGETGASMQAQVEAMRPALARGLSRPDLLELLPPGGARNALDCALWDLESGLRGMPVWQLAGLQPPATQATTRTLYADTPECMARSARALAHAGQLKLKLLGDGADAARVQAVRDARADALLLVDANQGLHPASYCDLLPALVEARVALIEQPFPVGREAWLDDLPRPIRVAADESVLTRADLGAVRGRADVVNVKLDKTGGLTEALALADAAAADGFGLMVGCMCASSIALAPAHLLAQRCELADIDGPLYLERDVEPGLRYDGGLVHWRAGVWGGA